MRGDERYVKEQREKEARRTSVLSVRVLAKLKKRFTDRVPVSQRRAVIERFLKTI